MMDDMAALANYPMLAAFTAILIGVLALLGKLLKNHAEFLTQRDTAFLESYKELATENRQAWKNSMDSFGAILRALELELQRSLGALSRQVAWNSAVVSLSEQVHGLDITEVEEQAARVFKAANGRLGEEGEDSG